MAEARVVLAVAAILACLGLWYPSAAVGVLIFQVLGQPTYLTFFGLLPLAAAGAVLVSLAVTLTWRYSIRVGWGPAATRVGAVVISWQLTWCVIAIMTMNANLVAWPYYGQPVEPEPWNPVAVFVTGFSTVALLVTILVALARAGISNAPSERSISRRRGPQEARSEERNESSALPKSIVRALVVGGVSAVIVVAPVLAAHNLYSPIRKWAVRNVAPYTHYIPVCPPWESSAWDLAVNAHARVNNAMGEWNEGGGELYFYRTSASCSQLDANDTPHVEVTWDSATGFDISVIGQMQPCYDRGMSDIFCNFMEDPPRLYRATIMLDSDQAGTYYWGSGSPPSNRHDVESVLVHEFGHTLMAKHFSGGGCSPGNNLVMCQSLAPGQERDEVWPGYVHDQDNYTDIYGSTH